MYLINTIISVRQIAAQFNWHDTQTLFTDINFPADNNMAREREEGRKNRECASVFHSRQTR